MSSLARDRVEHFRQRWAEENFNGSVVDPSTSSGASEPDQYLTEVAAPSPVRSNKPNELLYRPAGQTSRSWRETFGFGSRSNSRSQEYLTEVAAPKHRTFQPRTSDEETALPTIPDSEKGPPTPVPPERPSSKWLTELYTISWLIFFSLLGTLSRLGVEAISQYPNAPVKSRVLWANVGGSFTMGFLSEDKSLFRKLRPINQKEQPRAEAVAEYHKWKKTIPLFIGLSTGYCGSFTSFSSFIRDAFLELTNDLDSPSLTYPFRSEPRIASRNGGFSFLALLATLIIHPAVSIIALQFGAQVAMALAPITPGINQAFVKRILNPAMVFISLGCWLVASLVLAIIPPYNTVDWRTRAMFPLLFAPIGCLMRYYLSKHLNAVRKGFPLGTFTSNVFGTIVLGMCWDLQHANLPALGVHSATACALLVGVEEGFCGCLTTVSTWVLELTSLDRKDAWIYGATSVTVSLSALIVIMGSMGWTIGFGQPACG